MKLRSLALTAVAASSLGLAACGGDDTTSSGGGGEVDAKTLLASTFQPSEEGKIKSGKLEFKIGGEMSGATDAKGEASAVVLLNEAKDGDVPEFKADVTIKGEQEAQKLDLTAGGTYTDGRFYVSYDGEDYDVGEELSKRASESLKSSLEQAEKSSGEQNQAIVGQLGLEPDTWLTDPKVDGEEEVGGVDTYKITGAVDLQAMVPDILDAARKAQSLAGGAASSQKVPEVSAEDLKQAEEQIEQLDVAIWTGKDDKILRKVEVSTVINGDKDGDKLDGSLSLTLSGVNEQQEIDAPSDTKPITDLMPKLGGLFGAATGAGSAPSPSSGGAATPEAQVSQEYLECVNAAAGDAGKLNDCQSKLQP